MQRLYFCQRNFRILVLAILLVHAKLCSLFAQPAQTTPSNFKIAFFGDQGLGTKSQAVLSLIKAEGANAVLHLGDFDYNDDPSAWDDQINGILGKDFPYFACIGNHDEDKFYGAGGYQEFMAARMKRLGLTWSGDLGSQAYFKFHGILFVITAPGVSGSGHDAYINDALAADSSIWRVSSWHKNMRLMQVGDKSDDTGWGVYEESRQGGAIIGTGHEHSYSRTHLLGNCQNQIIASTSDTLILTRDQKDTPVDEGRTFVFVSGLGGKSIRPQALNGDWWANIYTKTQNATYGALFGIFNYNGIPNLAKFYFKSIDGAMPDSFFVLSKVAPPPFIATFTPARGPVGTPVTITGTNFTGATQVAFNGVAATSFTIISDTQIDATVPAGALIGKISVTTPTGTATSASDFTVTFPPSISAFAPTSGPVGTLVTMTGRHFTTTTQVTFDSVHAANFVIVSDTLLRVIVPDGATTGRISVTTTDGSSTSANDFVVTVPPNITAFAPVSGPIGTLVTITGRHFTATKQVAFNRVMATEFVMMSDTLLRVTVPAGASTGKISVTTTDGSSTSANDFVVTVPPNITAFAPVSGPVGTLVTITGRHFTATTQVVFNRVMTTEFVMMSDTLLRATVPAGATTGRISVMTTDGSSMSANDFIVTVPPNITAFAPVSGPVGTLVTITGRHFTATTQVVFNRVMTTEFVMMSDTLLRATVPAGATTGKVGVMTTDGSSMSANDFIVTVPPNITAFAPVSGPVGTLVTITGRHFTATTQVVFNRVMAPDFVMVSDTLLRATVPAGATTGKISVTTTVGSTASEDNFVVTVPPSISAFAPISGPVGTIVTMTGRHFTATTQVAFNRVMAPDFVMVSDTLLRATVPAGATTGKISVTTPDGTTSSTSDFIVETATGLQNKSIETTSGPDDFVLEQNHPNPFNSATSFAFWVPQGTEVTLKIYNVTGQEVTTLAKGFHSRGRYTITFEATDWLSGVYFIVLKADRETRVRRIIFTK